MSIFFKSRNSEPPAMPLEGVLGPNSLLDEAPSFSIEKPDALAVAADGCLLISTGPSVWSLGRWGEEPRQRFSLSCRVTALAASPGGQIAVGLETGEVHVYDMAQDQPAWTVPAPSGNSPAADCIFLREDKLAVVRSGYASVHDALARSPWETAQGGAVTGHSRNGMTRVMAGGLACPMGICRDDRGDLIITEMVTACVIEPSGRVRGTGFPAYIGRIRKTQKGYLLACLSRRDPLIEFLRTEQDFVKDMKKIIDPRHWISPRTTPEFSHEFPIELGATRLFGEIKPWAPSFSYGLLVKLDKDLMPQGSAQSRANGRQHAISDAIVWNGDIIAVSQASGEILNLGSWA
ncbi:hypothetical protein [Rhizobium lentis]|uniref:Strictosidine synthase n=2 Tax=Rhizobium TaxID=379 RepID=A0ABS7IFP4_9HYPH|nr:hypothetical protein [Rhizobium lentis]MBX5088274.1 hypothetical protein [Rhizobium lentis]MBX5101226.1 hypothetical protein [Rhizobium lentis]